MHKINWRTIAVMLHDAFAAFSAWTFAYLLRFNFNLPQNFAEELAQTLFIVVLVQLLIFWGFRLYRGVWRYASVNDLKRICLAVLVAAAVTPLLFWMLRLEVIVPRSVLIMDPLLLIVMMGGSRLMYRMWKDQSLSGGLRLSGEPVVVLGAGDAAASLIKALDQSDQWYPVGLLDDDEDKQGRLIHGVRILGQLNQLPSLVKSLGVRQAIIAMPARSHQLRRTAAQLCQQAGLKTLTVPAYDDLLHGRLSVSQLRPVELDDLLGRNPVQLDEAGLQELISQQTVFISGAGGSIGLELCSQVARYQPQQLVLFELNEFALYQAHQKLSREYPQLQLICAIGNVMDASRVKQVMQQYHPALVLHAAAYKHVPLMEDHNAWQAVRNNVLGTWTLAQAAIDASVARFVMISTDKAVNPTNVMGASKRLAEMVCQSLHDSSQTQFVMVRFGNVLGSHGSVIPLFRQQIAAGGPVTVTHPEITRFFMSIPEAAQLVLQAGLMGESGQIFVLDMGEPIRIVDLAKDMIRLSGFAEQEVQIKFTGLRPGEKLYEELLADDETTLPTPHPKLRIAKAIPVNAEWRALLAPWLQQSTRADDEVRQELHQWLPEYQAEKRET